MSAEHGRYASLISADIAALEAQVANHRAAVDAASALLAADEKRLEELKALLKHIGKAESS